KAVGRACYAEGLKEQAADHYRRAIELHDKVGIKRELEDLAREIKKENAAKTAAGQPNNEPAPQSGPEPTPEPELKPSIPEQPAPADGEVS
ncbi:MAG: phage terminase small subunit, partial [Aeromonas sobria]